MIERAGFLASKTRVRILSGPLYGEAGWVSEWVVRWRSSHPALRQRITDVADSPENRAKSSHVRGLLRLDGDGS